MMRILYLVLILLGISQGAIAQTLPQSRAVDWTLAGLRTDTISGLSIIDMQVLGVVGDGLTPNDAIIPNFIATFFGVGAIFEFPSGNFLFNSTISLPSNFIIRGKGVDSTTFLMDLGGSGHSITTQGVITNDSTLFLQSVVKDSNHIVVWNPSSFSAGDWVQVKQYDTDWVNDTWAEKSVGQIVQIDSIVANDIWFTSPLRMDYDTVRSPYIQKINPKKNIGIECLKLKRIDDTAPQQASNFFFKYAVNCWVKGVESENCTFSHVKGEQSSNLYIGQSYFHHGFDYGGGGRAYGVVFQATTGECLAEDNIFEHLRHSMLLQSGANGNVFAYNYSFDPYWSSTPNNSAGDMVLHGNYPYSNLFEQNICRNIVIDDSHDQNGPHNTFLRNRSEGYGIFFSAANSPNQNFLGNDVTNTGFPYSFVNYSIQGTGHFIHGNNDKGTIKPTGTQNLPDLSYAYASQPAFVSANQWAKIGTPNSPGVGSIPAKDRYVTNSIFSSSCSNLMTNIVITKEKEQTVSIYPNPVSEVLNIESKKKVKNIYICNELGQIVQINLVEDYYIQMNTKSLRSGIYFVKVQFDDNTINVKKVIKI